MVIKRLYGVLERSFLFQLIDSYSVSLESSRIYSIHTNKLSFLYASVLMKCFLPKWESLRTVRKLVILLLKCYTEVLDFGNTDFILAFPVLDCSFIKKISFCTRLPLKSRRMCMWKWILNRRSDIYSVGISWLIDQPQAYKPSFEQSIDWIKTSNTTRSAVRTWNLIIGWELTI